MLIVLFRVLRCLLRRVTDEGPPPPSPPVTTGQERVVILGGGVAGVATAFWLTAPEQNKRFQVTLYTQGWRLGGKCASGRNHDQSDRIEEHGLHMLMGCYQNAFTTIRACYGEWKPPANGPFQTWTQAFLPQRQITLMEQDGPGTPPAWSIWNFANLPQWPGEPGDSSETAFALEAQTSVRSEATSRVSSQDQLIVRMAELLRKLSVPLAAAESFNSGLDALTLAIKSPLIETASDAQESLRQAAEKLAASEGSKDPDRVMALGLTASPSFSGQRAVVLAILGVAIGLGYLRDIFMKGASAYDALNTTDFRAWLGSCGATAEALASAPIRAIYDLAFAFPEGNAATIDDGSMAAGVTLRFVLEIAFGYNDAPLWRMAAGTGDTVFTPLYQVLQSRGVSFQFFHRVADLHPNSAGTRVDQIDISQQAAISGNAVYQPLTTVGSLQCWPNQPDWTQLVNGSVLRTMGVDFESSFCTTSVGTVTLKAGGDFDIVILAIPPEALKGIASSLTTGSPKWNSALATSRSVATHALQVWMKPDTAALGGPPGPTVLTSYAETYDSWGDMSPVLAYESWLSTGSPQSLAYFCGCMQLPATGPIDPKTMLHSATTQGQSWLEDNIGTLWPTAPAANTWWTPGGAGIGYYDKANFDLSDLYVQTPFGDNVASRFSSSQPAEFSNLFVVGDWTKTRFSGGCFESAVESAMLASCALSGYPVADKIKTS
jgi:uncharacterized protein with NAD-binding domain and iron-sulfur cluster